MGAGRSACDRDTEEPFWVTMPLPAPGGRNSLEVCYRLKRGNAGRCAKYWLQPDNLGSQPSRVLVPTNLRRMIADVIVELAPALVWQY
jgi:hypothetical protein